MLNLVFIEQVFHLHRGPSTPHCPAQQTLLFSLCFTLGTNQFVSGCDVIFGENTSFIQGFFSPQNKKWISHHPLELKVAVIRTSTPWEKNIISKGGQKEEEYTHVGLNQISKDAQEKMSETKMNTKWNNCRPLCSKFVRETTVAFF